MEYFETEGVHYEKVTMALPIRLKNFVHFSGLLNFVTSYYMCLKLGDSNSCWAYEFNERNVYDLVETIEETTLHDTSLDWQIKIKYNNMASARHTNKRTIVSNEQDSLIMKCQLSEGNPWSSCEWRHTDKSITIFRDTGSGR